MKKCRKHSWIQLYIEIDVYVCLFLQTIVVKAKKLLPISDRYELVNLTLCDRRGEFHDLDCVDRCCEKCGIAELRELIDEDEVIVLGTAVK